MSSIQPLYVVDVIGEVVAAMQDKNNPREVLSQIIKNEAAALEDGTLITNINYQKGYFEELIETLFQMDRDPESALLKYPLIYLVQDFTEDRNKPDIYGALMLDIVILHQTQQTYKIDDRYAKVFKPVLYPLYYSFLDELCAHKSVMNYPAQALYHYKTDRSYWGRASKSQGTPGKPQINDFVDGMELNKINLQLNFNC